MEFLRKYRWILITFIPVIVGYIVNIFIMIPFVGTLLFLCTANSDNNILVSHRRTVCRSKLETDTGNVDKQL